MPMHISVCLVSKLVHNFAHCIFIHSVTNIQNSCFAYYIPGILL